MAEALCEYRWTGSWGPKIDDMRGQMRPPVEVQHFCVEPAGHIGRHGCHCGLKSSSGIAAAAPEFGQPCTWQPVPDPLHTLPNLCPQCGHLTMAHVGCERCPVCVLVWQTTEHWRRQQARLHGGR